MLYSSIRHRLDVKEKIGSRQRYVPFNIRGHLTHHYRVDIRKRKIGLPFMRTSNSRRLFDSLSSKFGF